MRKPIFVRELTEDEHRVLKTGVRSANPFKVRRSQIILASARGEWVPRIAEVLGCKDQTVRNAIVAFNERGISSLRMGSRRPKTARSIFDVERTEHLRALLHNSPREFGKETSVWTLELAAEVSFAEGLTPRLMSGDSGSLGVETFESLVEASQTLDHKSRP